MVFIKTNGFDVSNGGNWKGSNTKTSRESTTAAPDMFATKRATSAVLLCDAHTTGLAVAATDPAFPPAKTSETAAMDRVVLTDALRGASAADLRRPRTPPRRTSGDRALPEHNHAFSYDSFII